MSEVHKDNTTTTIESRTSRTITTTTTTVTQPSNIYRLSNQEVKLIEKIVVGEAGGCSEDTMIVVANVILNRLKSNQFPETITEIVYQPGQFSTAYSSVQPTSKVKKAVAKALPGYDNSRGALFFYASKHVHKKSTIRWFESLHFVFEMDGQRFFK